MNKGCLLAQRAATIDCRFATGIAALVIGLLAVTGCTSVTMPIDGIPAERLPPQFLAPRKSNLVPIDVSLLTLEPPVAYRLAAGDVLGVYVDGVLPWNAPGTTPELPPVHFPDGDSRLPPSTGFPTTVQEDGTLALPLIKPLMVEGLTLAETREAIRQSYIDSGVLRPDKARPIVTLIRERTYDVMVIREDAGGVSESSTYVRGSDHSRSGRLVKLPAYQNDILHALVATGGLPGLHAKNQVTVLRASDADTCMQASLLHQLDAHQAACASEPCGTPTVLKIPLRLPPGVVPALTSEQITLYEGDVVLIEAREAEVFYTGGLLPGGEHLLPRDYDLDVLGAMAVAGKGVAQSGQGSGGGGFGGLASLGGVPPGKLYILRNTNCGQQVTIEVGLAKAINDPRARPLVQAGDTLILQYKCEEELINFGLGAFFTLGIRELFRGR